MTQIELYHFSHISEQSKPSRSVSHRYDYSNGFKFKQIWSKTVYYRLTCDFFTEFSLWDSSNFSFNFKTFLYKTFLLKPVEMLNSFSYSGGGGGGADADNRQSLSSIILFVAGFSMIPACLAAPSQPSHGESRLGCW